MFLKKSVMFSSSILCVYFGAAVVKQAYIAIKSQKSSIVHGRTCARPLWNLKEQIISVACAQSPV